MQKCRLCGMQVSTAGTPAHEASKTCQQMAAARRQHAIAAQGKADLRQTFTAYGEPLKRVHLQHIEYYIQKRRHTIARTIEGREILEECRGRRGAKAPYHAFISGVKSLTCRREEKGGEEEEGILESSEAPSARPPRADRRRADRRTCWRQWSRRR